MRANKGTGCRPSPYLDNTETTQNSILSPKRRSRAISEPKSEKKSTIESLEFYRHLSEKIALTLIDEHSILAERAEKMMMCGTVIETTDEKVSSANFCRQRLCPMCQRRRSLDVAANTRDIVAELTKMQKRKFLHLVLTVPNVSATELAETINAMYRASSEMFRSDKLRNKFKGVMRCLEVTYNKRIGFITGDVDGSLEVCGRAFHPHLHCLVAVGSSYGSGKNYIKQSELLDLWRGYMGNAHITQLHIERVKDEGAISEVAKYCVKPLELDDLPSYELRAVLETLHSVLHGRRLIQLFGEFKTTARALKIDMEAERNEVPQGFHIKRYLYNRSRGAYDLISGAAAVAEYTETLPQQSPLPAER